MTQPTIHLNGTSRDALLEQARAVSDALYRVLGALSDAHPNARDYYPQGDGAYTRAADEWLAQCKQISAMRDVWIARQESIMDAP